MADDGTHLPLLPNRGGSAEEAGIQDDNKQANRNEPTDEDSGPPSSDGDFEGGWAAAPASRVASDGQEGLPKDMTNASDKEILDVRPRSRRGRGG